MIHESETCNVFLIEWPAGTGLDWHDHGNSLAHIQILEGRLWELGRSKDDSIDSGGWTFMRSPLDPWMIGPNFRHRLYNPSTDTALSLHTYFPPLKVEYDQDIELTDMHLSV